MINEKTASASEILMGALQDHDRATIVGSPSYGKGLVQNVMTLTGNTAVALTTAFYYTPSGRSIQKPLRSGHLEIEQSKQEYRTDSGRVVHGGGGIEPDVAGGVEAQTRLRVALDWACSSISILVEAEELPGSGLRSSIPLPTST